MALTQAELGLSDSHYNGLRIRGPSRRITIAPATLALTIGAPASFVTDAVFAALRSDRSPLALLAYAGPVSNDPVTIGFRQSIAATGPLHTGAYGKTLVFTLSTSTP